MNEEPSAPTRSYSILLVEDDLTNQFIFCRILKSVGYSVQAVHDGSEALNRLEDASENTLARRPFDAVITDYQMPLMSGIELARKIRNHSQPLVNKLPIILLTAHDMEKETQEWRESGVNTFLKKPCKMSLLLNTLRIYLESGPLGGKPIVDSDRLNRLFRFNSPQRLELTSQIITLFLKTAPIRIAEIKKASLEKNLTALRQAAHTLRGSCGAIGATRLEHFCQYFENLTPSHPLTFSNALTLNLETELALLKESLLHYEKDPAH